MEAITNAYQGFAKQNYTMLDNLKLGYGGTKTEMERLLADAQKLTGVKYDINNLSDVYQAIHAIQNEMGIIQKVSYDELNEKYNDEKFQPIDGTLVRICDHLSALMEASISINHGITSEHLEVGLEATVNHYKKNQVINGINVYDFFNKIITS